MNKNELVSAISEKMGTTKVQAEKFIETFQEVVIDELANGGNVRLVGFGNFEVIEKSERIARNPKTGEEIVVPAKKAPKFKSGKVLKDSVNE